MIRVRSLGPAHPLRQLTAKSPYYLLMLNVITTVANTIWISEQVGGKSSEVTESLSDSQFEVA